MKEQLFRKKSMDRISSPEQLNDYVKVSNPSVWMILFGIIILLAGTCVWGIFGRLDTTLTVSAVCADGVTVCYVKESDITDVSEGMTVRIDGTEYKVKSISGEPVQVTTDFQDYALHIGSLQTGEWVYKITVDSDLRNGIYAAEIVTESIAPMSFLVN